MPDTHSPVDAAARVTHRHILGALALLLVLGMLAILGLGAGSMAPQLKSLWTAMPLAIVILVGVLAAMRKGVDARSRQAARMDELHVLSLQRALRNGFIAVLGLQPVLMIALSFTAISHPVAMMGLITLMTGGVTVLGSVLWYDR